MLKREQLTLQLSDIDSQPTSASELDISLTRAGAKYRTQRAGHDSRLEGVCGYRNMWSTGGIAFK